LRLVGYTLEYYYEARTHERQTLAVIMNGHLSSSFFSILARFSYLHTKS